MTPGFADNTNSTDGPFTTKTDRELSGLRIVVKVGGEIVGNKSNTTDICHDIAELIQCGVQVTLVHGGGPQITSLTKAFNLEAEFLDGLRVTDAETMRLTAMALVGD